MDQGLLAKIILRKALKRYYVLHLTTLSIALALCNRKLYTRQTILGFRLATVLKSWKTLISSPPNKIEKESITSVYVYR